MEDWLGLFSVKWLQAFLRSDLRAAAAHEADQDPSAEMGPNLSNTSFLPWFIIPFPSYLFPRLVLLTILNLCKSFSPAEQCKRSCMQHVKIVNILDRKSNIASSISFCWGK